jgi:hypothetical protein
MGSTKNYVAGSDGRDRFHNNASLKIWRGSGGFIAKPASPGLTVTKPLLRTP